MAERDQGYNILVVEDGASGVKISVFDSNTFKVLYTKPAITDGDDAVFPGTKTVDGREYVNLPAELDWFDKAIKEIPEDVRTGIGVIGIAARGGTCAFIGKDGAIIDCPDGGNLVASYAGRTPKVEALVKRLFPTDKQSAELFAETGSPLAPGYVYGVTRGLEIGADERLSENAEAVAIAPNLIALHFLDNAFLKAKEIFGAAYSIGHSALFNINESQGTPSSFAKLPEMQAFMNLLPSKVTVPHTVIGNMSETQKDSLGLSGTVEVTPGIHDTPGSHTPIWASARKLLEGESNATHVELGSWTMCQYSGDITIPEAAHKKGLLAQGSVDGNPSLLSIYGGGFDFRFLKGKVEEKHHGGNFGLKDNQIDTARLAEVARSTGDVLLPNIDPMCHGSGPWSELEGRINNPAKFFENPEDAYLMANLMVASTVATHVDMINQPDTDDPIILTGGGAKDPLAGRLLSTLTGRKVYLMEDNKGNPVSETTALGAAMIAKAAVEETHPDKVDISPLDIKLKELPAFEGTTAQAIKKYRMDLTKAVESELRRLSPETLEQVPAPARPKVRRPKVRKRRRRN